jgi:dihydrofolate reductase
MLLKSVKRMIKKIKLSIIVAVAENYAIGKNNKLLWHISEDMKWFKRLTDGHTVIMGKNTYYSLPFRPLKNRINIVITDIPGETIDGCVMAYSIDDAIAKSDPLKENFVIGGASIYRQFFPLSDRLYITHINKSFEADTFFPEIKPEEWEAIVQEQQKEPHPDSLTYKFVTYERL